MLVIDDDLNVNGNQNALNFDAIIKNQRKTDINLPKSRSLNDHATLMMSSGSTGRPKAIIRTNRNILSLITANQHTQIFPLSEKDSLLSSGFCHGVGQKDLFCCINAGALLAINRVDENHSDTFEAIHKYEITNAFLIPTQLNFLSRNCGKYNKEYLKSLRNVFSAGAFLNEAIYYSIVEKYNFDKFKKGKIILKLTEIIIREYSMIAFFPFFCMFDSLWND